MQEVLDIKGRLTLQKCNAAGEVFEEIKVNNSIVLTGRDLVAKLFAGVKGAKPVSHVAVGKGDATANVESMTGLQAELFRKKLQALDATSLADTKVDSKSRKIMTLKAELDFQEPPPNADGKPHLLTEAGLFNAADPTDANGVMYNRVVFPSISKTTDFKLTLIWEIIF